MSRTATINRETGETNISISINLDGSGAYSGTTGNGMLDHMLAQLARHGTMDISLTATADITPGWHHLVEDTAIVLGRAFWDALGEARGIRRMAHAIVPLDEALAMVAIDISGRGYVNVDLLAEGDTDAGDLNLELGRHFLESFGQEGHMALYNKVIEGSSAHHKLEAVFKALAKALADAITINPLLGGSAPSTKGTITE